MGENSTESKNFVFTIDGKNYSDVLCVADLAESIECESLSDPMPIIPTGIEITLKPLPKVSRKRFINLLMAEGASRNQANEAANIVVRNRASYKTSLFFWRIAKIMPQTGV